MNPRVLRRFVILCAVATFVMFSLWAVIDYLTASLPGDYEVRQGDILLTDQKYDQALERFDAALKASPNHRGALMGRAIAFLQSGRQDEAEAEFTYLIDYLNKTLGPDDPTGRGVLAGAYANRGILYDRGNRHEQALADYRQALRIDPGAVEGPGLAHRIIYGNSCPATVKDRAVYLEQQLALPEAERLLRVPELDDRQRTYKP
jgi:tetratricopeptide (TPR) repeat protein